MKIVKYYADWCGPCKHLAPMLDEISKDLGVEVESVNVDSDADRARANGIKSLPTMQFVVDDKVVHTLIGLTDKEGILDKIAELS